MITLVRTLVRIVALALALLLIVGFAAQFAELRRYPWIVEIWSYLRPLSREIGGLVPTIYNRVDVSLLLVVAVIGVGWAIADGVLARVEDTRRGRVLKSRVSAATKKQLATQAERAAQAARPAAEGRPHTRSAPRADGARVYRSEALVVIDVMDSTGLVTRFGNALLAELKRRLEEVVTPICERHAAIYSKGTGDGYLVSFSSVAQGTGALEEIFAALPSMNEDLPDGAELALRGAMNFGEVIVERDSDRTGGAVHKTFRLQSLSGTDLIEAEGGIKRDAFPKRNYVIVSEEAVSGLKRVPEARCRFLGLCELKGFPGLHRVYQLHWDSGH